MNNNLLNNKVAFISGCAKGIGRAIAESFLSNGAIVYANDIREGSLDELSSFADKNNYELHSLYFDITDRNAAKQAIMQIKKEQGRIDCLVNNAGIMIDELIGMVSQEIMRKTFEINVFAAMELLQLAARLMIRQQGGSIINIASIVGTNGNRGQLVYSASKGAVISMTKTAAKELAQKNIRVNAVAPGVIDTDLFRAVSEEEQNKKIANIAMGRVGTPEDVAKACVFLASDLSEYVTGQILGVDGAVLM